MHARLALGEVALSYHSQELPHNSSSRRRSTKTVRAKTAMPAQFFSLGLPVQLKNCKTDVQRNAEKESSNLARWEVNEKKAFFPFPSSDVTNNQASFFFRDRAGGAQDGGGA